MSEANADQTPEQAAAIETASKAARIASMAVDIEKGIQQGQQVSFDGYKTERGGEEIDHQEFVDAQLIADRAAALSWGVVAADRRLSRDTFDTLTPQQQLSFVKAGGTLFAIIQPVVEQKDETMQVNGKQITRAMWDSMSEPQRMAYSLGK